MPFRNDKRYPEGYASRIWRHSLLRSWQHSERRSLSAQHCGKAALTPLRYLSARLPAIDRLGVLLQLLAAGEDAFVAADDQCALEGRKVVIEDYRLGAFDDGPARVFLTQLPDGH